MLHHLLNQKITKRNALQAFLTGGDRVEDRGIRRALTHNFPVGRQNRLYRIRHAIAKRHFHENQRIIRHQGVKKSVATAILRLQPPPQVFPIINLMNRFILNNLFKNIGRRLPVDPAQHQKPPIKPGIKEMPKIQIHPFQGFFRLGHDQQLFSQPHQPRRGVGKLIQSP